MITTRDQANAGALTPYTIQKTTGTMEAVGVWHSLLYAAGGGGVAPSPGINGAALTSYGGQLPFTNPGGALETKLLKLQAIAGQAGTLILADRLWHNSGISSTTTTAQSITSPTFPARDRNGATLGHDIWLGIEVSAATTNAGAVTNMTAAYTDQDGAASTATMTSFPATAALGSFLPFNLAAGDQGVRGVTGLTLGTSLVTGAVHLVAYRILGMLGLQANIRDALEWVRGDVIRAYDNTVPWLLWVPSATTTTNISAQAQWTQG